MNQFELSTFNLLIVYPSTIVGLLPHGALTFFIYPEGVGRTNVTLGLWFTEAGFEMDDYDRVCVMRRRVSSSPTTRTCMEHGSLTAV